MLNLSQLPILSLWAAARDAGYRLKWDTPSKQVILEKTHDVPPIKWHRDTHNKLNGRVPESDPTLP